MCNENRNIHQKHHNEVISLCASRNIDRYLLETKINIENDLELILNILFHYEISRYHAKDGIGYSGIYMRQLKRLIENYSIITNNNEEDSKKIIEAAENNVIRNNLEWYIKK